MDLSWLSQAGPWGLLSLAVLLVLRGWLVPRRSLLDIQEDRDYWRAAHERSENARRISVSAREQSDAQIAELLEHARTTDAFIRSLPLPAKEVER